MDSNMEKMSLTELKQYEDSIFQCRVEQHMDTKQLSDDEINAKYLKGEVRIVTEQARYPLATIHSMFADGNYILMPDFQRRHRWGVEKQSKLIESFIMNVPVPPIFLYEAEYSVYEVMDGLQRITAIIDFYKDRYALKGLEQWSELNGRTYSTLPEQVRKGIDRRYISSIILLKETAKSKEEADSLKQMVFSRINSGGAKLEDQEFRNSQNSGAFNSMIIELARDKYFCEIFDIPQKTQGECLSNDVISDELRNNNYFKRMKDVETVLRFFAMRNIRVWGNITLTKFLDQISEESKKLVPSAINTYKWLFEETIRLAYDIYGENAFRLWKKISIEDDKFRWTGRPNLVVYDPVMQALSQFIEYREMLIAKKEEIIRQTQQLFKDNENIWSGRNTSRADVEKRITEFTALFDNVLE